MNKRILKKAEKELKIANGHRRIRILTLDEIEKEIDYKVYNLLKNGLKKKYLNKIEIYNTEILPTSYKYTAYYTKYDATLNRNGGIKEISIKESVCPKSAHSNYEVSCNIKFKLNDFFLSQIYKSLENEILNGKL